MPPSFVLTRSTPGGIENIPICRAEDRVEGASGPPADLILAGVYAIRFGATVQDLAETWAPNLPMAEGVRLVAQSFTIDAALLSCCAA